MAVSQIILAGELDRRIRILGLTEVKVEGENTEAYADLLTTWAKREDVSGVVDEKAGADTALFTVQFTIRYNTELLIESKNYEALMIGEDVNAPVYMRDLGGEVLYGQDGKPLIQELKTLSPLYKIESFVELGRTVGMQINCEGWR